MNDSKKPIKVETEPYNTPNSMKAILDMLARRPHARANQYCVSCKGPANKFKDRISVVEYNISALCQKCQDDVFESPEPTE
jgi:hypothetical protein